MIYEYKCKNCGLVFTDMRKIADREKPIECYSCGGEGKVMISTPVFQSNNGKGWAKKGEWK
jgi:putative FmdB family regulatory protein